MGKFGEIINTAWAWINAPVNVTKNAPPTLNMINRITWEQQIFRIKQTIDRWRLAVRAAESVKTPNRFLLYQTYKDIVIDNHLRGLMEARKNAVLSKEWSLKNDKGEIDEEATKLLHSYWFNKFLSLAFDSKYYGYSLISFGDLVDFKFTDVELVPRQYVKPEMSIVVPTTASYIGTNYTESPYDEWCIGIGDKHDLGILMDVTPLVLWKKGAMQAWAEHVELFGMPIRVGKTNVRDKETRENMIKMVRDMGASAWAVFDKADDIQLMEASKGDVYQIYDKLIARCNGEISKRVTGQTMTTDDGSSRSQAEVHERVYETFNAMDEFFCEEEVVNGKLLPWLIEKHNFPFKGLRWSYDEKQEMNLKDQGDFDSKLAQYYELDLEYIENKYGTKIIGLKQTDTQKQLKNVQNRLKKYYGSDV